MANKFKLWVDDSNINSTQTYEDFSADTQRAGGFVGGTPASAIRVNTALRQANLIACALMDAIAPDDNTIDFRSTRSDVANFVKERLCTRKLLWSGDIYTTVSDSNALAYVQITNLPFTLNNNKRYEIQGYYAISNGLSYDALYWQTTYFMYKSSQSTIYNMGVISMCGDFASGATDISHFKCVSEVGVNVFVDNNIWYADFTVNLPRITLTESGGTYTLNKFNYFRKSSKIGITSVYELN